MQKIGFVLLVVAASLFECTDAHGFHHPISNEQDFSFENIVEQKYPTLPTKFISKHRRQLAKDFTHESGSETVPICDPKCYQNPENGNWLSCDDLIPSGYACSHTERDICPGKCNHCTCSCEQTCKDGRSCNEWLEADKRLTCADLETPEYGCNCRGCSCGDGCTQKCSMRDTNIKGSHDCATWYRMDPKYTTKFLNTNAVATDTVKACTCDGCNGHNALDFCPNDIPDKNSNYMDIETAKAIGEIGKMRLTIDDDMVDPEKCKNNAFCRNHTCLEGDVGKKVNNCLFELGSNSKTDKSCIATCTKEDILTKEKSFMVRRRFAWLKTFMGNLLSLKPTQDDIELNAKKVHFIEGLRDPETGKIRNYTDTDLVVVVTMRPSSTASIAGYAIAYQRDSERRATVGLFNWCPHTVDETLYEIETKEEKLPNEKKAALLYAKAADYRLMVHEILHLTGAIQSDPFYFINKVGKMPCSHQIYVDEVEEWSGHRVRKLRTPKLLARAREQFACSSLTGVPIEDHHIGYGSHWESRVFGPAIMSYGDNSGESYLSDLTLAFLEDTGYFVVNYTVGGRLTAHTASKLELADVPSLLTKDTDELRKQVGDAGNTLAKTSPGYTRWGRHAGCGFVSGSPKKWPAAYRCDSPDSGGCTPDNKMTARCTLETWGQTKVTAPTIRCEPPADSAWGGGKTSKARWKCVQNPGGGLPEEYRHLGPQTTLSGYNDAMDFVPHFVGYWNCQDIRPKQLSPLAVASEAGSSQNTSAGWDDLFGTMAKDASSIKGQSQCENCRCFKSSLVPVHATQQLSPNFPVYGLCYLSNCYSEEYLQVGIKGLRGLYWYGCHPGGGKMYVPMFAGALECPVAKEFCSSETISGIIYTETDANLEWIFYGVIGGVILIGFIVLKVFWKKLDHKVHFCCGINQDTDEWDKILAKRQGKCSFSGFFLTAIGVIWSIAATVLIVFGVFSFLLPFLKDAEQIWDTQTRQAPAMIAVGVFTLVVSFAAVEGTWKNKPTITLIAYFYVCCGALVLCAFVPFVHWILHKPFELILASQWVKYKRFFPDSWQGYNSTTAMDHFVQVKLPEYALYFAMWAIVLIVSVIGGIVCSMLQLTIHVVVRNFEVVMNILFCIGGGVLVYFAASQFSVLHVAVTVSAVIPACFLFLLGVVGVLAACQKHPGCFKGWAVLAAFCLVLSLSCASFLVWVSLIPVKDAVSGRSPSTCVLPDESSVVCNEPTPMCCSCVLAVDQVDVKLTTSTGASATTTKRAVAAKTFTRCEHSCFDVPMYACTEVGTKITEAGIKITSTTVSASSGSPMQIDPYIRSLDDDKISEISSAMSESLDLTEFDIEQLIAWLTAYLRIYVIALYTSCALICALFVTNRLIIHWNDQNDHPHQADGPVYGMLANSWNKKHMEPTKRSYGGNEKSIVSSIKKGAAHAYEALGMANDSVTPVQSLLLQDIKEITIVKDPKLGLGMSISTSYDPSKNECLVVNQLRYHDDGSPGPAAQAGMQVGDEVMTVDGEPIESFEDFKRRVRGLNSVTIEVGRGPTESIELEDNDAYPEILLLHIRRDTPTVPLSAKVSQVHGHGHTDFHDSKDVSFLVVKDVWGGPFYKAGVAIDDVILTVRNHHVESLKQVGELIEGRCEFDVVVKRMTASEDGSGHRRSKTHTCNVNIDGKLGLGLNLKEIQSGLGNRASKTFLYVKEVKQYPDDSPGPALVAGVRQHDLVLEINGAPVHCIRDAKNAIRGQQTASLVIRRMVREYSPHHPHHPNHHHGAEQVTVLIARKEGESMGLSVTEAYGAASTQPFLVVQNVRSGGAADRAGIQYHDIIWKAAGEDVCHLDEMRQFTEGLNQFELAVRRHDFENCIGIGSSGFDSRHSQKM